jgi:hypothetical protein
LSVGAETPGSEKVSSVAIVTAVKELPPGLAGVSGWLSFCVFSRNACEVFSKLRGSPMSNQKPVCGSFCRNLPGGSWLWIASTIFRATIIFCFFVKVTYISLFAVTRARKLRLPTCRFDDPPLPHKTSFPRGSRMLVVCCGCFWGETTTGGADALGRPGVMQPPICGCQQLINGDTKLLTNAGK